MTSVPDSDAVRRLTGTDCRFQPTIANRRFSRSGEVTDISPSISGRTLDRRGGQIPPAVRGVTNRLPRSCDEAEFQGAEARFTTEIDADSCTKRKGLCKLLLAGLALRRLICG